MIAHRRYFLILSAVYVAFWVLLAIDPHDRSDWALENALVVLGAIGLYISYRYLLLSRISYTLIFVFMCLHAIGAHWTYSLVPYDDAFIAVTGHSFNALVGWERNQYDRIVHFGLGAHCEADVRIRWPDAELTTQEFPIVSGYRFTVESESAPEPTL